MNALAWLAATAFSFGDPLHAGLIGMPDVNAVALRGLTTHQPCDNSPGLQDAQLADGAAIGQLLRGQEQGVAEGFLQMIQGSGSGEDERK